MPRSDRLRAYAQVSAVGLTALAFGACRASPVTEPVRPAPSAAPVAALVASSAPPIGVEDAGAPADAEAAMLSGPSFDTLGEDVVSLPTSASSPRPVVVGVHGSHDSPEAVCARWRRAVGAFAWVICPRGVPYRGGLAWGSASVMVQRIDVALAALKKRYGAYVADGPLVYAGWSLGGTRGPEVVALRPGLFSAAVLAEVGHTRIDARASLAALDKGRTASAVIACATQRCVKFEKRLEASHVQKGAKYKVSVSLVDAGIGRGHVFDDRMAREIGLGLAKVVADDGRWGGLASALERISETYGPEEKLPTEDEEPDLVGPDRGPM